MEDRRRNKSSHFLVFKEQDLTQKKKISESYIKSHDKKSLFDFISTKNRIILKSCFDHKGTKKFLLDKEKAMQEINLLEDIKEDKKVNKKNKIKSHNKHSKHHNFDINPQSASSSNVMKYTPYKLTNHLEIGKKNNIQKLSDKTNKYNDIHEEKNKTNSDNKLAVNKKRITQFNSISSNFSNIKQCEPLNLVYNRDDSLIHSIVDEMVIN